MILSDATLTELIENGQLGIEPFDPDAVQPASIDVRLGQQFSVMHSSRLTHIDPARTSEAVMESTTIENGDAFVIHPGEFALGHTAERITLPDDLVGIVNGKSSLGRLGLQVHATAGFVDPGFSGTIVLEFSNVANVPILLRPGMKVAQLVFQKLDRSAARPYGHPELRSKYQHQSGAVASKYGENRAVDTGVGEAGN